MNYGTASGEVGGHYSPAPKPYQTHEAYMSAIRDAAVARITDTAVINRLRAAKMVYGAGAVNGAKGFTLYKGWDAEHAFVELSAKLQTSPEGIAETVLHELGHVIAGYEAGHGKAFKQACETIGLLNASPYAAAVPEFDTDMGATLRAIPVPTDGKPTLGTLSDVPAVPRPCPAGKGSRGGKVGGKGSGSRLRLFMCACPVRVRVASDTFEATCNVCAQKFERPGEPTTRQEAK